MLTCLIQIYLKPTNILLELENQNGLTAYETACFLMDRVHKADISRYFRGATMNDSSRTDLQPSGRSRLDASQEPEKLTLGSSEPMSQIGSQN